jgi:hypothetical protein
MPDKGAEGLESANNTLPTQYKLRYAHDPLSKEVKSLRKIPEPSQRMQT